MGAKQSQQPHEQSGSSTINHPRYEKVKLLTSKKGEYMQISVPVVAEKDIQKWSQ
jgi:hypothetical protein